MAITTSTAFDKVRLVAFDGLEGPNHINRIELYNNGARVERLRPRGGNLVYGWDTTSSEFVIVRNAVRSGSATFEYEDQEYNVHQAADLPRRLVWMEEANVIKNEIDLIQQIAETSISGANLAIYKVAAADSAPTSYPPEFNATNNTISKWRAAIEEAGYALVKPTGDDVGDTEAVWETLAYYEYDAENEQYITDFSDWGTGTLRYSTNNGNSWTTEPPTSGTGSQTQYHVITHYQKYIDGTGWVTFTNNPINHTETGALEERSKVYTATNQHLNRMGFRSDFPRVWDAVGIKDGAFVGFEWTYIDDEDSTQRKIGSVEYPSELTPYIPPHEITDESQKSYGDKTFIVSMDQHGEMYVGRVSDPDALDYFADRHRLMGYFRGQPDLRLSGALAVAGATIMSSRKPTDVVAGMFLFLQSSTAKEVVRTLTVSQTPDSAGNYAITVQRGLLGTTAQFFPANSTLRGGGYKQSVRQFIVTDKRNLNRNTIMNLYKRVDR